MGADLRKIRPHLRITQNMKKIFAFSAFLSLCAAHLPAADVSADFAGGNAVIAASADGKISIAPDSSGCSRGGNYWNFRVRKVSGKLLEISVSGKNAVDACGAFVSEDSGKNWTPLGAHSVRRCGDYAKFSYRVSEDAAEVRFASVIPYLHSDFKRFAQSRGIAIRHFCKTERGRENVFVELGNENSAVTAILTCRHHACESAASFVLEGFLSSAKYAKNIRVAAFPLVDLDGVEEGEQGKFRKPRDHNQDYYRTSRYAATATLKRILEKLNADGKKTVVLDLHSPLFSEMSNLATRANGIYFVFGKNGKKRNLAKGFSLKLAERCNESGGLANNPELDVDFDPFLHDRRPITFAKWAERLENVMWSAAMEIPFAVPGGEMPSTPDQLRNFGKALLEELDARAGVDWESSGK